MIMASQGAPNIKLSSAENIRNISKEWLKKNNINAELGLPEFDDRRNVWRTQIILHTDKLLGEIIVDDKSKKVLESTRCDLIQKRILKFKATNISDSKNKKSDKQKSPPFIPNKIILGDACNVLSDLPPDSVQLIFTSPPYYNAKPEYAEYLDYQEYLDTLRKVFLRCHSVLSEGRFLVVNISPVLIRRASRSSSSKRLAVPFDVHALLDKIGFDFIDDIIWEKPSGAGWATGRGRRFAADRNPLQYKTVPVTEYILVYRKKTEKLIDWNIRSHYDQELVKKSKITGEYDATNIWSISPTFHKVHPAVFPESLAEKIIRYYSFKKDLVLDPFAGTGTVGKAALKEGRRFLLIDNQPKYFEIMTDEVLPLAKDLDSEVLLECEYDYESQNYGGINI